MRKVYQVLSPVLLVCCAVVAASAQSFRVQCPNTTTLHTSPGASAAYSGPKSRVAKINQDGGTAINVPYVDNGGAIKCQQISGGDGYATMGDGTQTYLFAFGPLSGLNDLANGRPATELNTVFNTPYDPAAAAGTDASNGAVGLATTDIVGTITDATGAVTGTYNQCVLGGLNPNNTIPAACNAGHVDARAIMDVGVMNGNMPAPLMAIDEDDEFFLTLTNVGMMMRPDLFEQHTVHFHGYPNASSFYDGVPDASVAINIGGSFTYYYLAPDAGTYFWHCHITPPEHLQMGMVGQLYVRPRQDRVPSGTDLYSSLLLQQNDLRTKCGTDILCSTPLPAVQTGFKQGDSGYTKYAYNDGDGSTRYDVEYPIQIHGFDPNFHFVGMTFNPEAFADIKDKYFLLNGRSYPDTVRPGTYKDQSAANPGDVNSSPYVGQPKVSNAIYTQSADGVARPSQPLNTLITIPHNGRALLRISDLDVSEFQTLASLGIPMQVIAINARLLRDEAGNNLYYTTNSITLGGGESLDVILDANGVPAGTYYLYTPNLDHLSNDAENFGGLMTEVIVQ
jgi:FtsP/CotA-like multicopper oxidase with cupredoxin domain